MKKIMTRYKYLNESSNIMSYADYIDKIKRLEQELFDTKNTLETEYKPKIISFINDMLDKMEEKYGITDYMLYLSSSQNIKFREDFDHLDEGVDGVITSIFIKNNNIWVLKSSIRSVNKFTELGNIDTNTLNEILKLHLETNFFRSILNEATLDKVHGE